MKNCIKLYSVTFNNYTNALGNTVTKPINQSKGDNVDNLEYLYIPMGGLIVKEYELQDYMEYGDGFESIKFVGSLLEN